MNFREDHSKGKVELEVPVVYDVVRFVLEVGDELGWCVAADVQFLCKLATVGGEHFGFDFLFLRRQGIIIVGVMEVLWILQVHF